MSEEEIKKLVEKIKDNSISDEELLELFKSSNIQLDKLLEKIREIKNNK